MAATTSALPLTRRGIDPSTNWNLSATPTDPPLGGSGVTYSDLCVISDKSGNHYVGTAPGCQQNLWTLQNSAISSTIADAEGRFTTYGSEKLDISALTLAGEFIIMQEEPNNIAIQGDYGLEPNNVLYVPDAGGEFSNFWLCPLPDGSEGLAIKYGFHKGYGTPAEEASCAPFEIRAVEPAATGRRH